jgi:hypothetical protein
MTRTVLVGSTLALVLVVASLAGCKDNEESFYIEHMKAIPDAPECKYSTGDPAIIGVGVDLARRQAYDFFGGFQVTNALMAREDYDNLKAESNGIFVDGSETEVTIGGESAGGSAYSSSSVFIDAETTDVLMALVIPSGVFDELAASYSCPSATDMFAEMATNLATYGGLASTPTGYSPLLDSGYVTVQLLGHTQGGVEVETNRFTVIANFCCGCTIDFSACDTPCDMFCGTPAAIAVSCATGVNEPALADCAGFASGSGAEWPDDSADGGVADCDNCGT